MELAGRWKVYQSQQVERDPGQILSFSMNSRERGHTCHCVTGDCPRALTQRRFARRCAGYFGSCLNFVFFSRVSCLRISCAEESLRPQLEVFESSEGQLIVVVWIGFGDLVLNKYVVESENQCRLL